MSRVVAGETPPWGALDPKQFTLPVADAFICPLCHLVFDDPSSAACGHTFCNSCVAKWLESSTVCPVCSSEIQGPRFKNFVAQNLIGSLSVRCSFDTQGCDAVVRVDQLGAHKAECGFGPGVCPHKGCQHNDTKASQILRQDQEEHARVCDFRIVECPNKCCEADYNTTAAETATTETTTTAAVAETIVTLPFKDVANHLGSVCLREVIPCDLNCGSKISRGYLQQHKDQECERRVLHCDVFGCDFSAEKRNHTEWLAHYGLGKDEVRPNMLLEGLQRHACCMRGIVTELQLTNNQQISLLQREMAEKQQPKQQHTLHSSVLEHWQQTLAQQQLAINQQSQAQKKQGDALNAQKQELEELKQNLEQQKQNLEKQTLILDEQKQNLEKQQQAVTKQYQSLNQQQQAIAKQQQSFSQQQQTIAALQETCNNQKQTITLLTQRIATLEQTLDAQSKTSIQLQQLLTALQQSDSVQLQNSSQQQQKITSLQQAKNQQQLQITAMQQTNSQLQMQIDEMKSNFAALQTDLMGKISELQTMKTSTRSSSASTSAPTENSQNDSSEGQLYLKDDATLSWRKKIVPNDPKRFDPDMYPSQPYQISFVHLNGCGLTATQIGTISQQLTRVPHITKLNLGIGWLYGNHLGVEGMRFLCTPLRNLKSLKLLDLCHCVLGPEGGVLLAGVLPYLVELEKLFLQGNGLCDTGVEALLEPLCKLRSLNSVSLENNKLTPSCRANAKAKLSFVKKLRIDL